MSIFDDIRQFIQTGPNGRGGINRIRKEIKSDPSQFFVLSPTAIQKNANSSRLLQKTPSNIPFSKQFQSIGRIGQNTTDPMLSGQQDIRTGIQQIQKPGMFNKASAGAKMAFGASRFLAPGVPLYQAANVIANQNNFDESFVKRGARGIMSGMSDMKPITDTKAKNIRLPVLGNVDPAEAVGGLVGFTQNPLRKGIFNVTETILPAKLFETPIKKWLAITTARGGIEGLALGLAEVPENASSEDKFKFILTQMGQDAAMELFARAGLDTAGKGIEIGRQNEIVDGVFEQLKKGTHLLNAPVKTMEINPKTGERVVVPMWRYQLGKMGVGLSTKDINELSPEDYAKVKPTKGDMGKVWYHGSNNDVSGGLNVSDKSFKGGVGWLTDDAGYARQKGNVYEFKLTGKKELNPQTIGSLTDNEIVKALKSANPGVDDTSIKSVLPQVKKNIARYQAGEIGSENIFEGMGDVKIIKQLGFDFEKTPNPYDKSGKSTFLKVFNNEATSPLPQPTKGDIPEYQKGIFSPEYKLDEQLIQKPATEVTLYRGGLYDESYPGGKVGIPTTVDKNVAFEYANKNPNRVSELKLRNGSKVLDYKDIPKRFFLDLKAGNKNVKEAPLVEWAKQQGYDAIDLRPANFEAEIKILNPKALIPSLPQPTKGGTTLNDLQKSGLVSGFAGSPPKGAKERGFVKTVRNAESTAKPVSEQVKGYYKPITNKDTLNQAQSYIDTLGWDKSKQKVLSEELTAENNAIGLELMRRAQDEGRYDEAIEVAEALSKKGTEAGQAVQAFAIWGRMTPEGMTRYAVKQIEKAKADMGAVTKLVRDLTGKKMGDIKLTMEDSKKISSLMKKANNAKSEADRMKYTKQALEVINDRIPYGVSDLVDEMRYNNMLSNPKSHLRNAYQNALNTLVTKPATLVLEGKPIGAAKYYSGVLTGLPEATNKALKTIAGEVEIKKPDLQEVRTGKLPTIWQTPTRALEAGDQFFSALIKNGMQAAGASAEDAAKAAEYTLLRTDVGAKGQGHLLSAMDTVSNWLYKAPKPVRWFVPFVRTPMNAAKQWIEFSPAGLATVPGSANQREQLAKTMVGSMAMFVGARMAAEDRVTWSAPTDPKEKQLFYASGRKPFSIRMGDKWVPLFYAGPFAATMALPAAVKHYQDENRTALTDSQLDKITDVSADMLKFVMGQTPLTGLNTFVKLAEGDIDYSVPKNLGFTASQLIPGTGLLNYIADVLDPIYRKPSGFAESIKSGIPGMTQDLQAYTEPTGEPSTRLPQNYVMPYDLGQANQSYEMPYQQRKQELQQNAVINQFKKQVSDQVDLGTSPASGFQPTDKLGASLATLKESEEQKERFSRSREFMQFYNQNPQAVVQSIQQLGIDPNDAVFDYVANQSVDARTPFVASMIEGIQDRNQMLGVLAGMRKEVNGNKLLSDGVIDNLHDEGIIGPNEKRMLKNLEFDKDGEIKKSSGKGKKIKVPSLISTSQLLTAFNNYMKAKTTMPKSSSSRNLSDLYAKRRQRIQNIF